MVEVWSGADRYAATQQGEQGGVSVGGATGQLGKQGETRRRVEAGKQNTGHQGCQGQAAQGHQESVLAGHCCLR